MGTVFCGDVVLDSFNMVYSDENIYENESAGIFIMKFFNFKSDLRICISLYKIFSMCQLKYP